MNLQTRGVIVTMAVITSCQLIGCTGLCKFARMFPAQILESTSPRKPQGIPVTHCTSDTLNDNCTCSNITFVGKPRSCFCWHNDFHMRQCEWLPNDCYQLRHRGIIDSGIYTIQTLDNLYINVSCDMTTDDGGWTIFQRRINGSVRFDRGWTDYKEGFGLMNHEFWLGNDNLHQLTLQRQYTLRIDIISKSGESLYATYNNFTIEGEVEKYRLASLGEFEGTPGLIDAMSCHKSMNFSTKDYDNDRSDGNCASTTLSGWWFNGGTDREACPQNYCKHANLNRVYGKSNNFNGIVWSSERGLQLTEMKIRPCNADTVTFI